MEGEKKDVITLRHNLGSFEGFNFRDQCAICGNVSAEDVVNWNHDAKGDAEFWPSGDCEGVALIFRGQKTVTASELIQLDELISDLGENSDEHYVLIHYALRVRGYNLEDLTVSTVCDDQPHIFTGQWSHEVRESAAYALFEEWYPDAYSAWEKSYCDGLIFDPGRFLDSPALSVEEVKIGGVVYLLITPQ